MPVHQIAVVPARETASDGKSAPRSKDKSEGGKTAGRSGSRSSTISKASSSTTGLGAGSASRTSVTPSSQDICSSAPLPRVEEDAPEVRSHPKPVRMPAKASQSNNQSTATAQKKQVKRRHRRKRDSNATLDGVSPSSKKEPINSSSLQEPTNPSSKQEPTDRSDQSQSSEQGEKRERVSKPRRELPPRHRGAALPQPDTSEEEDERSRQSRSWSQEKARRGRHRSGSRGGGDDGAEPMELQSVGSDEAKENQAPLEKQAPPESEVGLQSQHGVGGAKEKKEGRGSLKGSTRPKQREGSKSHSSSRSPKGSSSLAEDGEELTTKRYKERGSGSGDMSVPSSRRRCSANVTAQDNSDDSELEVCRICHCEGDEECPLITPCFCTGSLRFVHQDCLNQWIKSSDTRCCELCKYNFIMETQLKPLRKWEKLEMTKNERRKIFCSVMFHLISVGCVLWSIYILVQRTAKEIGLGKDDDLWRMSLVKYYASDGVLEWPFWTKLILVAVAFSGGLIFMYIQCKVYLQLWRRLKAFNRIITVQNCPENGPHSSQAPPTANGKHEPVEVPMGPMGNCGQAAPTDSDLTDDTAVAPEESPV